MGPTSLSCGSTSYGGSYGKSFPDNLQAPFNVQSYKLPFAPSYGGQTDFYKPLKGYTYHHHYLPITQYVPESKY